MRPGGRAERRAGRATFMAGMALFGLKPGLLEHLRKQKGVYSLWATSVIIGGVWLTDWKVILGYVPWINGKFKNDEYEYCYEFLQPEVKQDYAELGNGESLTYDRSKDGPGYLDLGKLLL